MEPFLVYWGYRVDIRTEMEATVYGLGFVLETPAAIAAPIFPPQRQWSC